jgi:hypothetical protein
MPMLCESLFCTNAFPSSEKAWRIHVLPVFLSDKAIFFYEFVTGQNCTEKPWKGQLFSTQVQMQEKIITFTGKGMLDRKRTFLPCGNKPTDQTAICLVIHVMVSQLDYTY